jgi:hypothetical protein
MVENISRTFSLSSDFMELRSAGRLQSAFLSWFQRRRIQTGMNNLKLGERFNM